MVKEYLHLGIIRSTLLSTANRTSRHINLGQSSFFAPNRTGTRFGCLHPITALWLYTNISLRMLYGAELWSLSITEMEMLERARRRILRTIRGLPLRSPKEDIGTLLGCPTISDLISQKKLSFLLSIFALPNAALPKQVLQCRPNAKVWNSPLEAKMDKLNLPSIATLMQNTPPRAAGRGA